MLQCMVLAITTLVIQAWTTRRLTNVMSSPVIISRLRSPGPPGTTPLFSFFSLWWLA
jgi:hypothetical protein